MLTVELWVYAFIHYSCSAYVSFMLGHHFSTFLLVSATISDLLPHHASLFSHISTYPPCHASLIESPHHVFQACIAPYSVTLSYASQACICLIQLSLMLPTLLLLLFSILDVPVSPSMMFYHILWVPPLMVMSSHPMLSIYRPSCTS